jgi:hypothetical protein
MTRVLELPSGNAKCPGVVILHEWWGVNEQMHTTARLYAEEGFIEKTAAHERFLRALETWVSWQRTNVACSYPMQLRFAYAGS